MPIGISQGDSRRPSRRLSYANVMATLAVFIALGGTGYAMSQINGSEIKNRSIAGEKLKPHTLTAGQVKSGSLLGEDLAPHSVTSNELRDLVVSRKARGARATTAQASTGAATILTLSVGQSVTVVQSGPFTYSASCTAGPSGQPLVTIYAVSTEAGSLLAGGPTQLSAGQPVVASGPPSSDEWDFLINGARMLAPSGASLIVQLSYGTNLFGGQCWASGFGID
jgi:hypothetical protein